MEKLAIYGGTPVRSEKIFYGKPVEGEEAPKKTTRKRTTKKAVETAEGEEAPKKTTRKRTTKKAAEAVEAPAETPAAE